MVPTLPLLLDRSDPSPLSSQIADQIRRLALNGGLVDGAAMPSTRRLALDLGVARGVVEQAWDQLRAEGWIEARPGSGTWLRVGRWPGTGPTTASPEPAVRAREPLPVMLDAGTPWRSTEHLHLWRRAWREVSTATPPSGYEHPAGLPQLRELLAARLHRTRGLDVSADRVIITSGTVSGWRQLLGALPAGPVAVEDPGYRAVVRTASVVGRGVVSLPLEGPPRDLSGVAAAFVTPSHQHPTGRVMSGPDRMALLAAARETDTLVVEDDYDSEFRYDVAPVPALATMAPDRVAYLGTASKTVLPSMRLGWMVVPESLQEQIVADRVITFDVPPWPVQRALVTLLRDGYVDAVIRSARRVYAERALRVVAVLSPHAELAGPVAGMYSTWLLDQDRAVRARDAALAAGYRVNLLSDYCRNASLSGLLVGFGGPSDAQLDEALGILAGSLSCP